MRWAFVFVLVGCTYSPPVGNAPDDGNLPDDSSIVEPPDAAPGEVCLGEGEFRVCVPAPAAPFAVTGSANTGIDTDASPPPCIFYPQPNDRPSLCVIAGTTITIDANILFISGTHPAVLFATETISIGNGVDVGSHRNGQAHGAGADSASCNAPGDPGSSGDGGGGGAGGSFGTKGGDGGDGGGGGGGGGGSAGSISAAGFLRGGCPGGDGGDGLGSSGGDGNRGGGAVLLLAGTSISITGFINASGGGGSRGLAVKGGAGGGGSGGMIAMSAPTIAVTGRLVANGGGGGGGASAIVNGDFGSDPDPDDPNNTANGGSGGGGGGNGAAGAAGTTAAGNTGNATDGAGGAGGGLGVIRILSGQTIGGTSSPMPLTQ